MRSPASRRSVPHNPGVLLKLVLGVRRVSVRYPYPHCRQSQPQQSGRAACAPSTCSLASIHLRSNLTTSPIYLPTTSSRHEHRGIISSCADRNRPRPLECESRGKPFSAIARLVIGRSSSFVYRFYCRHGGSSPHSVRDRPSWERPFLSTTFRRRNVTSIRPVWSKAPLNAAEAPSFSYVI